MISVIVPVYNVEDYLAECLLSILSQSYSEFELILVNDGSTDNSLKICEDFAIKDNRIKIITQNNGGLSAARNAGIGVAQGEYITFIDSDDMVFNDMFEYLLNIIDDSDMSVCQMQPINEKGKNIKHKIVATDRKILGNRECMKEYFSHRDIGTVAWGKLYKAKLFANIRYPEGKYHEDVWTTYLVIAQCDKIAIGSEKKYFYRQREGSITQHEFSVKHLDSLEGNIQRAEFIRQNYIELLVYAEAGIIYSANQCVMKLINMKRLDLENQEILYIISYLQIQYRKYEISFLKGKSNLLAKLFSVLAWICLRGVIKIMNKMWKMKF